MERQFSIIHVTGESKLGGNPDSTASQIMRGMRFVPVQGSVDSPNLHKNAKPEDNNTFVRFSGNGNEGTFRIVRAEGNGETVLDEGKVFDVDRPTPSVHTTTLYANGRKLSWEFCCLPRIGATKAEKHNEGNGNGAPSPPPPHPDPPPPEDADDQPANPEPPTPPKPKKERKPRMPRPNRPTNLDRLLDLKGKMDNDVATTSDVVEVIIAEMDAEGKKGDNLARIMKALDRSIPWVYRHYQLRHLADRLKPLIDEMGTSVAVEISTAPDSDQWNIWQQVQQEEKPRKRAKLAQRLAKKSKASVLEEKPACAPQRKGKREKKGTGELSAREQEVVALREQGKARKEIGDALGISVQTVGKHLQNIRKKLGAPPRTRKETRRGTTVENAARPAGTETGVEAINRLVQTLGTVDMNSDVTDGSFLDFASGQTPSNMQRILERGEVIKNAIERIRTAYKKVSLPLLKDN